MLLNMRGGMLPLEIKSMTDEQFDALQEPLPDNVFQVMSYQKLGRVAGMDMMDRCALIYCTKKFKWGSPYKEYHVSEASHPHIHQAIEHAWEQVVLARSEEIPARLSCCSTPEAAKRVQCPLIASCFQL